MRCPVFQLALAMESSYGSPTNKGDYKSESGEAVFSDESIVSQKTHGKVFTWLEEKSRTVPPWINKKLHIDAGQNPAVPFIFAVVLAILIISVLLFFVVAFSSITSSGSQPQTEVAAVTTITERQPDILVITLTPTLRSAFVRKMGVAGIFQGYLLVPLETPIVESSPITIVVTPTQQSTETTGYYACGAPLDWVPYTVQAGDSLSALSFEYNVPLYELSSNNCLGMTEDLLIGQQIYLP